MNKKVLLPLLCFCLLCGYIYLHNPERKITLTLGIYSDSSWDVPNASSYATIDKIIKSYEKKFPFVNVQYESGISKDDYSSWLANKIVMGEQPDVYIVPREDFNLLSNTKALEKLNNFMDHDLVNPRIFYPASYHAGVYRHTLYGLPVESNPLMMCVNMNLLKKENIKIPDSWTIEDFYKICQKVTKDTNGDGVVDQYGSCEYSWQYVVEGYGLRLFDDSGENVYLNNSDVKKALRMARKIYELNEGHNVTSDDFDQGKVAFMPMTLAQYRTYKPYPYHVTKYSTFSWNCHSMPVSSKKALIRMDTSLMAMSSSSDHKKMAWEFLKMMCMDQEQQQLFFTKMQGASPLIDVMNSTKTQSLLKEDNFGVEALSVKTINEIMKSTSSYPKFKKYNTIMDRTDYLITRSIQDNTVDTSLEIIEQKIESEL